GSLRGQADAPSVILIETVLAGETDDLPLCAVHGREVEAVPPFETVTVAAGDFPRQDQAASQQIEKTRLEMPCPAMDGDDRLPLAKDVEHFAFGTFGITECLR